MNLYEIMNKNTSTLYWLGSVLSYCHSNIFWKKTVLRWTAWQQNISIMNVHKALLRSIIPFSPWGIGQ